jgi:hypothetical protein
MLMKKVLVGSVLFMFILYGCAGKMSKSNIASASFMSKTDNMTKDEAEDFYKAMANGAVSIIDFVYSVFDEDFIKKNKIEVSQVIFRYSDELSRRKGNEAFAAYCGVKYIGSRTNINSDRSFCYEIIDGIELAYISKEDLHGWTVRYKVNHPESINLKVNKVNVVKEIARSDIAAAKKKVYGFYELEVAPKTNIVVKYIVSKYSEISDKIIFTRDIQNNSNSGFYLELGETGSFIYNNAKYTILYEINNQTKDIDIWYKKGECARSGNTIVINPMSSCEVTMLIIAPGLPIKQGEPLSLALSKGTYRFTLDSEYTRKKQYYDDLARKYGL